MKRTPLKRKTPLLAKPRVRRRKCRGECGEFFKTTNPFQVVCGRVGCALSYAREQEAKKRKAENAAARERLKPAHKLRGEAQVAFNAYIRWRDRDDPCISCDVEPDSHDALTGGGWDCGHFLTVGARPELRFDEANANKQCKHCNGGANRHGQKAGTVSAQYRRRLILKIGLAEVERLEGPHEPMRWRAEDFRRIRDEYRAKLREEKALK